MIIPSFENPEQVAICLSALARSTCHALEVVVVDDGSSAASEEIQRVCAEGGVRWLKMTSNSGPAAARNAGARAARGGVLLFLDSDVAVHADTLERIAQRLSSRPELAAVFGAYDDKPAAPGTVSRFRNLLHHFVHTQSAGAASTFWAGCGAIRRSAFESAGGFTESYRQASIEDVELGVRLHRAGFAIELDPAIQVTHTKQWTLLGMFRTDLFQRAAPWTELALQSGGLPRGLNFGWANRICVLLAGMGMLAPVAGWPLLTLASAICIAALNLPLYGFVASRLGMLALPVSVGAHIVHFCAAFLGLLLGSLRHARKRDPAAGLVCAGLLAVAAITQIGSGAYTADFAGHPDEPAHFVSAVMVSRFLDTPFQSPLHFASRYYAHYPKVGIGHWPPLGYLIQGMWMRAVGVGRTQALLLVLAFTALAAFLVYELLRAEVGRPLAVSCAAFLQLQSTIREGSQQVMMDIPVLAVSLMALLLFRHYVTQPGGSTALGFGLFAAMALLIKANAVLLALLPPSYIILARKWDLIRRGDFWMFALPPLLLALPWYIFSAVYFYRNFAGWAGIPLTMDVATKSGLGVWVGTSGAPLAIAAAIGLLMAIWRRGRSDVLWTAVLASCAGASYAIRAMGEARHQMITLTAMVALVFLGLRHLPRPLAWITVSALLVASWRWTPAPHSGYTPATLTMTGGPPGNVLLSGPGDGAVVAAATAIHPHADGQRLWLRANKLMGDVTWSGTVRSASVTTPEQVRSMLDGYGVNQVLVELIPALPETQFGSLLLRTLEGDRLWGRALMPVANGGAVLFRRVSPLPGRPVSFYLPRLGAWVGNAESK
ncbi:MAG: glycosyltransferase [Acidobacteria bacterium]|nr:glycosyltransferase [Acidobacteriota bacterium]